MKRVTVVGGGFSGLATAHYLTAAGIPVEVVERSDRCGGMIATIRTPHGPVETAATGLRNSRRSEDLFRVLGLPPVFAGAASRARYVFRGRPRRWPLGPGESLGFAARAAWHLTLARGARRARARETVREWGNRVAGAAATKYLLAPVCQGIYAGAVDQLSASLVWGGGRREARPAKRGLVSAPGGMGELVARLAESLENRGVRFHMKTSFALHRSGTPAVICTSIKDAAAILRPTLPATARRLDRVEMVPLVTATVFYAVEENSLRGFGVLIPRTEGFRALGVLFNANIFDGRGPCHSETWIFGGAEDRPIVDLPEKEILDLAHREGERLHGRDRTAPLGYHVQRWRDALPHYDVELEEQLEGGIELPDGVFLVGNWLGGIGLARILDRAHAVAQEIARRPERSA